MPNGQSVKLLKTLLSSACERDCFYCPFRAGRDLLRVPGIGPKGVDAILKARHAEKLNDINSLRAYGINASRAAPFILLDGKRPAMQLSLF